MYLVQRGWNEGRKGLKSSETRELNVAYRFYTEFSLLKWAEGSRSQRAYGYQIHNAVEAERGLLKTLE